MILYIVLNSIMFEMEMMVMAITFLNFFTHNKQYFYTYKITSCLEMAV